MPVTWTDTIRPAVGPGWTGSTDGTVLTQISLINTVSEGMETGWARFDISNIPDNNLLSAIKLGFYVNSVVGSPFQQINHLSDDPLTGSPFSNYTQIILGNNYYTSSSATATGWQLIDLPNDALTDFSNSLLQNWFAFGFVDNSACPGCFIASVDGWNEAHLPYLVVDYSFIPGPHDLGITAITAPSGGAGLTSAEPVTVIIKNYGTNTQTVVPVVVTITGPTNVQTLSSTYVGNIAPLDSAIFVVGLANFQLLGNYTIQACTSPDDFQNNNCFSNTVIHICPLQVSGIISPVSGSGLGPSEPLIISLTNVSNYAVSNVPVSYSINGSAPTISIFPGPIAPGTTVSCYLNNIDCQFYGNYSLNICLFYPGDLSCCFMTTLQHTLPVIVDTLWPQQAPKWTGSTDGTIFTQNSLIHMVSGGFENGWAKFDLTGFQAGASINTVELHYFTSSVTGPPDFSITRLPIDPVIHSATDVMNHITGNSVYSEATNGYTPGWHMYNLGDTAASDLFLQTVNGWFAVGFRENDLCPACYSATIDGWSVVNIPYLVVNMSAPIAHDIAVLSIDVDTAYFSTGPYIPKATVKNVGTNIENFTVTMSATGGYSSTISVSQLPPGAMVQITFSTWNKPVGPICIEAQSNLPTDINFGNNWKQLCWNNIIPQGISGTVTYNNNFSTPLTDSTYVLLIRTNPPGIIRIDTVDANGHYSFSNVLPGVYNLEVQSDKTWGGGNAVDALMALKHFIGQQVLTGMALEAADVSGNGVVNSLDALMIVERFMWIISSFPASDWISETPFITMPMVPYNDVDLKAVCSGDINGSFVPQ